MSGQMDYFGLAVALSVAAFTPKQQAWASENGVKFHIEAALSNDKAGQEFTALCGVKGDYLHQRGASQNFMRCEKCLELSSVTGIDESESVRGVLSNEAPAVTQGRPNSGRDCEFNSSAAHLEIAGQGKAPQRGIESLRVGDEGGEAPAIASPLQDHEPIENRKAAGHEGRNAEVVTVHGGAGCGVKSPVVNNSDTSKNTTNNPTGAADCTSLDAAPEIISTHCHRVSGFTLYERVTAVMADAAFIQSAQFWGKVISKCEDVSLEEGYRLEDLDAEREGASL